MGRPVAPRTGLRWTDREISRLKSHAAINSPDEDVAADLGRTIASVSAMRLTLGLTKRRGYQHRDGGRPWSDLEVNRALAFKRSGWANEEIAKELNRSPRAVASKLDKIKAKAKTRLASAKRWPTEVLIAELEARGFSVVKRERVTEHHALSGVMSL